MVYEKEALLDEVTDLLTSVGLEKNDEVNQDGLVIEDLIDLLMSSKPYQT